MALADEVIARFGASHLQSLTNPDDPDNTAYDATKLAKACSDMEGLFRRYAETTLDITNPDHLEHAVAGVEIILMMRMGQLSARAEFLEWKNEFDKIRTTGSRARVTMDSNSLLTVTDPGEDGATVRPWSEEQNFRGLVPDDPNFRGDGNRFTNDD